MFSRPSRGLLDFIAAALCLWAAAYHTPAGALIRDVLPRASGSRSASRPLLAYYSGGVYDGFEGRLRSPRGVPLPDEAVLAAVPPGQALGRGVYVVASRLDGRAKATTQAMAASLGRPVESPEAAAFVVDQARARFGSDEAAVLAVFVGLEATEYAVERARAEGRPVDRLEVLAQQLPPTAHDGVASASSALTLGTAWGLGWPLPLGTRVSSPFGWREHPLLGRGQFHTGVDLSVPEGTKVRATGAGVVRRASEDGINGRIVVIDHGRGVSSAYCHNTRLLVTTGQPVRAGDVIAESGSTGRSTGPHLHYQLELGQKPVDPLLFRARVAQGVSAELLDHRVAVRATLERD